jgi:hypothetical protein
MNDEITVGSAGIVLSYMAWLWAEVYPWVTGLTALLGLVLVVHGVVRLVWRWKHGYSNFLTTSDVKRIARKEIAKSNMKAEDHDQ